MFPETLSLPLISTYWRSGHFVTNASKDESVKRIEAARDIWVRLGHAAASWLMETSVSEPPFPVSL